MYLRNPKFEGMFDGKVVTATLSQLTFADAMVLEAVDDSLSTDAKNAEFASILSKKLASYVLAFDGPVDSEGEKVGITEVCNTAYFAPLVVAMGKRLIDAASPPKEPPVV